MLTHERLLQLVRYAPDTGTFTRLTTWRRWKAGQRIGSITALGYVELSLDAQRYLGHRVAWFYMAGAWPEHEIDHRDGARANNEWSNLRAVTRGENRQNTALSRRNTSGYRGVVAHSNGHWTAWIAGTYLGYFHSAPDASDAYLRERARLFHLQPVPRELMGA
jgi:hypothetical protein